MIFRNYTVVCCLFFFNLIVTGEQVKNSDGNLDQVDLNAIAEIVGTIDPRSPWQGIQKLLSSVTQLPKKLFEKILMALVIPGSLAGIISGVITSAIISGFPRPGIRFAPKNLYGYRYTRKKHLYKPYRDKNGALLLRILRLRNLKTKNLNKFAIQ